MTEERSVGFLAVFPRNRLSERRAWHDWLAQSPKSCLSGKWKLDLSKWRVGLYDQTAGWVWDCDLELSCSATTPIVEGRQKCDIIGALCRLRSLQGRPCDNDQSWEGAGPGMKGDQGHMESESWNVHLPSKEREWLRIGRSITDKASFTYRFKDCDPDRG